MAVRHRGDYYSVPPFDSLASVISLGESVREVVETAKERIAQVEAINLNIDFAGIEKLQEEIQEGKRYGINF